MRHGSFANTINLGRLQSVPNDSSGAVCPSVNTEVTFLPLQAFGGRAQNLSEAGSAAATECALQVIFSFVADNGAKVGAHARASG